MKRRNDQPRWHVQRNCWESLGLMEAEECATCTLGTRLGYSSTESTAGCSIRCRQTDRWCLVRDFKAENYLCFLSPPPPPTHVVLSPSTFAWDHTDCHKYTRAVLPKAIQYVHGETPWLESPTTAFWATTLLPIRPSHTLVYEVTVLSGHPPHSPGHPPHFPGDRPEQCVMMYKNPVIIHSKILSWCRKSSNYILCV